jgi:Zinc knuckle
MEDIGQTNVKCFNCGKLGNFSKDCKAVKKKSDMTTIKCYNCQKRGHMIKDCPSKTQSLKGKTLKWKKQNKFKKCNKKFTKQLQEKQSEVKESKEDDGDNELGEFTDVEDVEEKQDYTVKYLNVTDTYNHPHLERDGIKTYISVTPCCRMTSKQNIILRARI